MSQVRDTCILDGNSLENKTCCVVIPPLDINKNYMFSASAKLDCSFGFALINLTYQFIHFHGGKKRIKGQK
jgi:hypothetical protein